MAPRLPIACHCSKFCLIINDLCTHGSWLSNPEAIAKATMSKAPAKANWRTFLVWTRPQSFLPLTCDIADSASLRGAAAVFWALSWWMLNTATIKNVVVFSWVPRKRVLLLNQWIDWIWADEASKAQQRHQRVTLRVSWRRRRRRISLLTCPNEHDYQCLRELSRKTQTARISCNFAVNPWNLFTPKMCVVWEFGCLGIFSFEVLIRKTVVVCLLNYRKPPVVIASYSVFSLCKLFWPVWPSWAHVRFLLIDRFQAVVQEAPLHSERMENETSATHLKIIHIVNFLFKSLACACCGWGTILGVEWALLLLLHANNNDLQ